MTKAWNMYVERLQGLTCSWSVNGECTIVYTSTYTYASGFSRQITTCEQFSGNAEEFHWLLDSKKLNALVFSPQPW